jgi:hypothetical protein
MTTSPAPIVTTARTITATLVAGLAVSVGAGLSLGAGTAHADPIEVKAGLTCDEDLFSTICTNTTNTDYTVVQTRDCKGGTLGSSVPHTEYSHDSKGNLQTETTYTWETRSVDPSTEIITVFVPAHDTGSGPRSSCTLDTVGFHYSVESPAPGPAPAPPPQ